MESYRETLRRYYDRRAAEYDDAYLETSPLTDDRARLELCALERAIAGLPPGEVLDVGCGTGFLTRHLTGHLVCLDRSGAMLEIARERVPHGRFVQSDALALPFPDASFDRVFAANLYGLLPGPEERRTFLGEARRVADELVLVETAPLPGVAAEGWQQRTLSDGSRHEIYRRYLTASALATELNARPILSGSRFVMVTA